MDVRFRLSGLAGLKGMATLSSGLDSTRCGWRGAECVHTPAAAHWFSKSATVTVMPILYGRTQRMSGAIPIAFVGSMVVTVLPIGTSGPASMSICRAIFLIGLVNNAAERKLIPVVSLIFLIPFSNSMPAYSVTKKEAYNIWASGLCAQCKITVSGLQPDTKSNSDRPNQAQLGGFRAELAF